MTDVRRQLDQTREQILVLSAQSGETDGFRDLVDLYERRLLYFIRRLIGDADTALDVLQETWITVHRRLPTLESPAAFRVWLYRIARDKAIDLLRRTQRHRELLVDLADGSASDGPADDAEFVLVMEDVEFVHHALARLSPVQREALALHFLEEMSIDEISRVVGCSPGTVKSRLFHARLSMRRMLEEASHV